MHRRLLTNASATVGPSHESLFAIAEVAAVGVLADAVFRIACRCVLLVDAFRAFVDVDALRFAVHSCVLEALETPAIDITMRNCVESCFVSD